MVKNSAVFVILVMVGSQPAAARKGAAKRRSLRMRPHRTDHGRASGSSADAEHGSILGSKNDLPLRSLHRRRPAETGRPASSRPRSVDLARIRARFAGEPSVTEAQRAAVRYAQAGRAQVRSWSRRVRLAPVLPEVRLGLDRSRGVDFSIKVEPGNPSRWNRGLDEGYTWGIQLKWELDRLIFDPDELKVCREAQRLAEQREEVLDQVTRVYFERRRMQILRFIQPPRTVRAALFRDLALQRLTATLDGLTGGWFSRELKRRARRRK